MNVEDMISRFYMAASANPDMAELLRPLADGLTAHADILRELPETAFEDILFRLKQGDYAHAMKAFVVVLTPEEKIGLLSDVASRYEKERARIEEAWAVTRNVALTILEHAAKLGLQALLARITEKEN